MAKSKGSDFEKAVHAFFRKIFEEIGYQVIEVRKQWSGTQNGFDVRVKFLDENDIARDLFLECKDYESQLGWTNIMTKVFELSGANYSVDGFVALSPKTELSNIDDNLRAKYTDKFEFPIRCWTPDSGIHEMFALDAEIYKGIYGNCYEYTIDRDKVLAKLKTHVDLILKEKQLLKYASRIEIEAATKKPEEDGSFVTNLDQKLDAVMGEQDPDRIEYHKFRCDFKVYLEGLTDVNNGLRNKILKWQDNLRLKAKRLTKKFNDFEDYTPIKFFHEFFSEAEKELLTFFSNEKLDGDKEKLLSGVIFELAAECPLDWRKNIHESTDKQSS